MDIQGKIAFLDRKLEHDRITVRASLCWMLALLIIVSCSVFLLNGFFPDFEGKQLLTWVAPGVFSISLPIPFKEYFARRQSIIAIGWMREQYNRLSAEPDEELLTMLDTRFTNLLDKVAIA